MTIVREPAVAGTFYPRDSRELRSLLKAYLAEEEQPQATPRALIAPHAGYVYSGPIAGSAYARLKPARDRYRRVVLLGPSHRIPFHGLAASSADAFSTPLGEVPIDKEAVSSLLELPQVKILDEAHDNEHSLEVHLPFLQETLEAFALVPLVVGDASAEEVEAVVEKLWDDGETLFVVSSDLSHYHEYAAAKKMDLATSQAIENLQPGAIRTEQACGRVPILGLLSFAQHHGLHAETVDLRNSGDTAGPRDQVVGYGAYVFT